MKKAKPDVVLQSLTEHEWIKRQLKTGTLFGYKVVTRKRDFKAGTVLVKKRADGNTSFVSYDFVQAMHDAFEESRRNATPRSQQLRMIREMFFGKNAK